MIELCLCVGVSVFVVAMPFMLTLMERIALAHEKRNSLLKRLIDLGCCPELLTRLENRHAEVKDSILP